MMKGFFIVAFLTTACFSTAKPAPKPKPVEPAGSVNFEQIQLAIDLCKHNKGVKRILTTDGKTQISCKNGAKFLEGAAKR